MNDFTKEELKDILHLIKDVHKGTQKHGLEWGFDLRDKIQSMIDNYCEHTKRQYYEHVSVYECEHCSMVSMI